MNVQPRPDGRPTGTTPDPPTPSPPPGHETRSDAPPSVPPPARPRQAGAAATPPPAAWERPAPATVWRAVELYLAAAYPAPADGATSGPTVPSAVKTRLQNLRSAPEADFWQSPTFERDSPDPQSVTRYALRLGNRAYPHMKLIVHRAPAGGGYLLRADTHDAHCRPDPGSKEYGVFCALMDQNRVIAESIESAWERADLPTFKKFLRDDLARRQEASR